MTLEGTTETTGNADASAPTGSSAERQEAHQRLQRIAVTRGGLDAEEARWLLAARRLRVHRDHGCATFLEYVERILGYGPRAATERLRVAEALDDLPATRAALAAGDLTYSAVREITRVVVPDTELAWVDQARGKTVREVEALVSGHRPGDRPEDPTVPDLRTRTVRLELSPESYALWREVEKRVGASDDSELVAAVCRAQLSSPSADDDAGRVPAPHHTIAMTVCVSCKRGWQDGGSEVVEVGAQAIERAACDAQVVGRVDVDAAAQESHSIPKAVRSRVFRRDHKRCVVPGCRSTRYLDVHHVVFRRDGGSHRPSNLVVLCGGHHDAVHQGRLTITGNANRGLEFKHGDGRPWGSQARPANALAARVRSGLRGLGFKPRDAARAVERGLARVGADAGLTELVGAALRDNPEAEASG